MCVYNKQNKTNILIIRKSAGIEDVLISLNKNKFKGNVFTIPRFILKSLFINFLGESSFKDVVYYGKNKKYLYKKKVYQDYITKLQRHIIRRFNINLIINFNVMYKEVDAFAFSSNINKF